jgi:signal transduction histidine kinase
MWGRTPKAGSPAEKYCGSFRLRRADGTVLPHSRCPMAAVLTGKISSARDVEVIMERPDGSRITVIANIVPLRNAQGETTGAINCFYDITERKRSEVALVAAQALLSKHVGKLESLVLERTAELSEANTQLMASVIVARQGKDEYQALLAESVVMQEKLRHLTRMIISAQEDERKRISRELHDEVVQKLIGINIELTSLMSDEAFSGSVQQAKIASIQRLLENSVNATHGFARELRPAMLDDLGLIPALHAVCKNLKSKKKLNIQMSAFSGVEALNSEGRTVLFRIAQEALTNISRHAHATEVRLTIGRVGDAIRMEVTDNGKSFSVEKVLMGKSTKRLGLIGMKERMEMIGGTFNIESSPGKGTTVVAQIPFEREKEGK